ncbi:MAG: reprolysin-like metallopeptidase, partial [Gammaproteobacteria bacterium]
MRQYTVEDSPVMAAELVDKYPEIKTFKVRAVDSPAMSGRVSSTPLGFHGYLDTENGTVYIDPVRGSNAQQYRAYYKLDYALANKDLLQPFSCGVHGRSKDDDSLLMSDGAVSKTAAKTQDAFRSYDIAIAATGEYSVAVTNANAMALTKPNVRTEIINAVNRINQIYERDLGVHLNYIVDDRIIYLDGASDPYTNSSEVDMLDENQANLDTVIGSANYDIGHIFSTVGGGLASLGVVCDNARKARGVTGLSTPVGDPFYIDFVAHEIGHQFNAEHTFNGTTGSCAPPNRNAATAVEPGSGSTVMSYAGICGAEDIVGAADDVFHAGSIEVITAFTRSGAAFICSTGFGDTDNPAPLVSVGVDNTIPGGTYFELNGSASDVDTLELLYRWDEMDVGVATNSATLGRDLGSNALFRSYAPTATGNTRSFPALENIKNGTTTLGETLPTESRTLHFRLTASDGKGGVDSADMQVAVNGDAGPFRVLQPNGFESLDQAMPQVIEWNAACSELAPVSCANFDIMYSSDGGNNFSLLESSPNDGEHTVNFPAGNTSQARIKIKCSDNIFFDISDSNFSVNAVNSTVLSLTGNGGSYNCGTSTGGAEGGDIEPNDSPSLANLITLPLSVSINGSVNSSS